MQAIRSKLARIAVFAAIALLSSQLAGAAKHHHHAPAADAHELAWCDGDHEPQIPGPDHDAQQCQACRHRVDASPALAGEIGNTRIAAPRAVPLAGFRSAPARFGVWSARSAPTRGPPLRS